jgi:N,N'-diacetyllegionaminate synthase
MIHKYKKKVFIIAEAGVNHNGNLNYALKLIDLASSAGADAIKFQTFKAEDIATHYARKANYQFSDSYRIKSQLQMLKKL